MGRFSIFFIASFFLLSSSYCLASQQDDKFVKVEVKAIDESYYSIRFCLPNDSLSRGQILRVELSYGSVINNDVELILAAKENTENYKIFEVDFDKTKISSDKNIFLRFVFLPLSEKEKKVVLYYNVSYVLSNVKASKNIDAASCAESIILAPVRIGGESVPAKM